MLILTITRMLKDDVAQFLILFVFLLSTFYVVLYILYPRAGTMRLVQVRM